MLLVGVVSCIKCTFENDYLVNACGFTGVSCVAVCMCI